MFNFVLVHIVPLKLCPISWNLFAHLTVPVPAEKVTVLYSIIVK